MGWRRPLRMSVHLQLVAMYSIQTVPQNFRCMSVTSFRIDKGRNTESPCFERQNCNSVTCRKMDLSSWSLWYTVGTSTPRFATWQPVMGHPGVIQRGSEGWCLPMKAWAPNTDLLLRGHEATQEPEAVAGGILKPKGQGYCSGRTRMKLRIGEQEGKRHLVMHLLYETEGLPLLAYSLNKSVSPLTPLSFENLQNCPVSTHSDYSHLTKAYIILEVSSNGCRQTRVSGRNLILHLGIK